MFTVSETEAAAIRTAFEQEGELTAAIELRRIFPGVGDMAKAREMARVIAGWKPIPAVKLKQKSAEVVRFPSSRHPPRPV